MHLVRRIVINKYRYPELYAYLDKHSSLACNLYNASLFRIRQIFTGYAKEKRTPNETEIFMDVRRLESAYPSIKVKPFIGYHHLEKLMRVTQNPDFFGGLPMQSAQAIVKQACTDFSNWLKAIKDFKLHPDKYLGRPKMPDYKKTGSHITYTISNQDAVIDNGKQNAWLKLPLMKGYRFDIGNTPFDARLAECKVKPYYGRYMLTLTFSINHMIRKPDHPNIAGVDFGSHNIAAIVSTDGTSKLYKGGAVMAENQFFAKRRADLVSQVTHGHKNYCPTTKRLNNLSVHHDCFLKDQCHKISRDLIRYCVTHKVGTIVLGVNKAMKQNMDIGRMSNQMFYGMPMLQLREMIIYKASLSGITVIEQEESYTSMADCTNNDPIPVYGVNDDDAVFSGHRFSRGLYRCHDGSIINADLNGAANILRKAYPNAFINREDFSFMNHPEVSGFHELNPKRNPVKRIEAA